MINAMAKEKNSVQTTQRAINALEFLNGKSKLPKYVILERTLVWLAHVDPSIRTLILTEDMPIEMKKDLAQLVLKSFVQGDPRPDEGVLTPAVVAAEAEAAVPEAADHEQSRGRRGRPGRGRN